MPAFVNSPFYQNNPEYRGPSMNIFGDETPLLPSDPLGNYYGGSYDPGFTDPFGNYVSNPGYDPSLDPSNLPTQSVPGYLGPSSPVDYGQSGDPYGLGSTVTFNTTGYGTQDPSNLPLMNQPGAILPDPSYTGWPSPSPFETGGPGLAPNPTPDPSQLPTSPMRPILPNPTFNAPSAGSQTTVNNYNSTSLGLGQNSPISASLPSAQTPTFQNIGIQTPGAQAQPQPGGQGGTLLNQIMWRALNKRGTDPNSAAPGSTPYDSTYGTGV